MIRWIGSLHIGQLVILWLGLFTLSGALLGGWMAMMQSLNARSYREASRLAPVMTQDEKATQWDSLVTAGHSERAATLFVERSAAERSTRQDSLARALDAEPSFLASAALWSLALVVVPLLGIPVTAWWWFGARRRPLEPTP